MRAINKWIKLKEEDVSPSKWFPISKHTVKLPNGEIVDDYFISHLGDVVMILPFTKEGNMILVRQYKYGVDEVIIELPAGYQQKNKTLEETAVVELNEETEIKIETNKLKPIDYFIDSPTKIRSKTFGYLADNLTFNSKQNLEITEDIEILIINPLEVLRMIRDGQIWASTSVALIMKSYLLFLELFK